MSFGFAPVFYPTIPFSHFASLQCIYSTHHRSISYTGRTSRLSVGRYFEPSAPLTFAATPSRMPVPWPTEVFPSVACSCAFCSAVSPHSLSPGKQRVTHCLFAGEDATQRRRRRMVRCRRRRPRAAAAHSCVLVVRRGGGHSACMLWSRAWCVWR